jgi:RNA polymerase sigma-70 factor, ECF subfamily
MKEENDTGSEAGSPGDAALIRLFLAGDTGAFDRLVVRHQDRVFNLCYRFVGDYHEANDLAQDVFIKVFTSVKKFRFKSEFSTWLYRIAVNTCRNRVKSLDFRFKKKAAPLHSERGNIAIALSDDSESPGVALEQKERSKTIQEAINALSGDKKTVLILRDMEGLTYEEIALVTGLNPGTVKSRLARARKKLKEKLVGAI